MKIKSDYLDMEFDVSLYEKPDAFGKVLNIIKHESLADVIDRQIPSEQKVNYNLEFCTGLPYPAFICTITDKTGKRVSATGSAKETSLDNTISQNFPVEMAEKRAFDRAALRYLAVAQKIYSDSEISFSYSDETTEKPMSETVSVIETEIVKEVEEPIVENNIVSATVEEDTETENNDYGSYVFNFGPFAGKNKTLNDIYQEGLGSKSGKEWLSTVLKLKLSDADKEAIEGFLTTVE